MKSKFTVSLEVVSIIIHVSSIMVTLTEIFILIVLKA